jgi:pyrroline-5-carboxylate reductase
VATANQEVLDACDVIFVAVLPAQAEATLGELTFKPDHKIISLMAGVAPATLQPWLKCVPIENVGLFWTSS